MGHRIQANVKPEAKPQPPPARLEEVQRGLTDFAWNLVRALPVGPHSNVLVSPFGLARLLQLPTAGAAGRTRDELVAALGGGPCDEAFHRCANAIMQRLHASRLYHGEVKSILAGANGIWAGLDCPLLPRFLHTLALHYATGVHAVDLADSRRAASTINAWVSKNTVGAFDQAVSPADLGDPNMLILINTLLFKARWATRFKADDTRERTFHGAHGEERGWFMHQAEHHPYFRGNGVQGVELAYQGDGLSMLLLLPDEGRLDEVQRSLSADYLEALRASPSSAAARPRIELAVPRFSFEVEVDLRAALEALGVQEAFTPAADFSGISPIPLYVGKAKQQAKVDVFEKGTEAAAVTTMLAIAVGVEEPPPPAEVTLVFDRPFLFAIRDRAGTTLFAGRVSSLQGISFRPPRD